MKNRIVALSLLVMFILTAPSINAIDVKNTTEGRKEHAVIGTFYGNTWYVGGSGPGNFSRIQDAINNASDGDTVFVFDDSSPYYENVLIDKTIDLIGENKESTLIDASGEYNVVKIRADGVNVSGFSLQNSGDISDYSGVHIRSSNNTITDNIFLNNYDGISIGKSNNTIIFDNIFLNNQYGIVLYSDDNIIFDNSFFNDGIATITSNNIVFNNTVNYKPIIYVQDQDNEIIDNDAGQIILVNCNNITIKNQKIDNTCTGIRLHHCNNCIIENNSIRESRIGITLGHSDNNIIKFNSANSNRNYGIYLYNSHYNHIEHNGCTENIHGSYHHHGMYLSNSHNNTIIKNWLKNNKLGIELSCSCDNNISDNVIAYNIYIGIKLYAFSERNKIHNNEIMGNRRGGYLKDVSHNFIIDNNFRDNEEDLDLEILQYLKFSFRKFPYIDGNFWDKKRIFPRIIVGEFTFVYMDVPYGGYIHFRFPFIDWHPAKEPYGSA
jgi:parallel beta-helix repeat protein